MSGLASLLQGVSNTRLARQTANWLFGRYTRRRVDALNHHSAALSQEKILRGLLRQAEDTRFGRGHDFATIRTIADYQQRVPLREYEAFWKQYWQPSFPQLTNVTWPAQVPYLALSSGTTSGVTKFIPVSKSMLVSNRRAALTALAWFHASYPDAALFSGRMFFLGGSTDLRCPDADVPQTRAGDLSAIASRTIHPILRPYTYPPPDVALLADWDEKLDRLARQSIHEPVTLVSGVPSWLLVLFDRLRQLTGREQMIDIWPSLRVVVHGGTRFDPYRALFRRVVGQGVPFLETYPASEGFIAAEDPRYGLLRLIPDHGVFFEFVPVGELGQDRPTRHTIAEIVPGVQYAVVLTTCAGLWSYILGDTVCFERQDPPLLRFTGRTRQYLSAFGEHLSGEEVERAITEAATATGVDVTDFHVGPVFSAGADVPGRHLFLVEFAQDLTVVAEFARVLDEALCRINEDYRAHRAGELALHGPEVITVRRGGFAEWMRSCGKFGGQHKVPRLDNTGQLTMELMNWLQARRLRAGVPATRSLSLTE